MKRRITTMMAALALMAGGLVTESCTQQADAADNGEKKVWICGAPSSKRYHATKDCKGLRRCSKTPRAVTLQEAAKSGLTTCKICY